MLAHPSNKSVIPLPCDASDTAIGVVIHQIEHVYPLSFFKVLNPFTDKYSGYDWEQIFLRNHSSSLSKYEARFLENQLGHYKNIKILD
ncbi:hypothetical protein CDAR_615681 [Caerostris darwini]|uniref:Uncharacterized protein n=1 Tax=Caerostris darwini TaxID=1538125 RepID=A0AAV4RV28_9ARAC|nr:hypothetical protein CDAR_615681 [Caerostris darwini]